MARTQKRTNERSNERSAGRSNPGKIDRYFPTEIERKWQEKWREIGLYDFSLQVNKSKYYVLVELPYPSGDLHIGHWFAFTIPDVLARFKAMQGANVFFPMGYDAFGLPAENAAIKRGVHPQDWTLSNIETMTKQFQSMGTMMDWRSTTVTCLPEYYHWNQWIFLQLYQKGLAYRGKTLSNWCEKDQTVLANEAIENGKCWRCGTEVVQKEIEQWFLKITDYADQLLWENTDQKISNRVEWPKSVREGQNNWIGKSEGALVKFKIKKLRLKHGKDAEIEVFTTRPDTLFGATFMVVAPEHDILKQVQNDKVKEYIQNVKKKTELDRKENKEKAGVFTGLYAINPVNGAEIPVWVADYVLYGYGTGAIMAVPAHDDRDMEFAKAHGLPIRPVIVAETTVTRSFLMGADEISDEELKVLGIAFTADEKKHRSLSIPIDVLPAYEKLITEKLTPGFWNEYIGPVETVFIFKFKDGRVKRLVLRLDTENEIDVLASEFNSREKREVANVWGWLSENAWYKDLLLHNKPGVIVNSDPWDEYVVPEAMSRILDWLEEKGIGKRKVQYHLHDWSISRQRYWGTPVPMIHCNKDGIVPVPEGELPIELPYDVDYAPKGKPPLASNEAWLQTTCPKCGGGAKRDAETLDTFFDSSWYYYRYVNPSYGKGPFDPEKEKVLLPVDIYFGGAEHTLGHTLYARFFTKFFKDLGLVSFSEFALRRVQHGIVLGPDGNKMSKSKGNVINPDDVVKEYGADAVRLYLCFMMPYEGTGPWSTTAMSGMYRFLKRVWELQNKLDIAETGPANLVSLASLHQMNKTIKKVTEDIADIKMNTAIAALMEWLNFLSSKESISKDEYKTFALLLAPFAPHMAEEIYCRIRWDKEFVSVHKEAWPEFDPKYVVADTVIIAVQINGKVRDTIQVVSSELGVQSKIEEKAKESEKVQKHLEGKSIRKTIYIPGKIISFVVV